MQRTLAEFAGEFGGLVFDLVVTVVLTAVGLQAELYGMETLPANTALAGWALFMGAVLLYAGVVVFGGRRLLPRLRGETTR